VNEHQKSYKKCRTQSISPPAIEQVVLEQIRGIAANPDVVADVARQLDEQRAAGVEGLERVRRVVEKELRRLGEDTAGVFSMTGKLALDRVAELPDRVAVLKRKLRDLGDRAAESVGQTVDAASVRKTLREFDGIWAAMTPREREKLVNTVVERATYDGGTCAVTVGFRTAGVRQLCLEVEYI
jgi:site-specific DNA recombinase